VITVWCSPARFLKLTVILSPGFLLANASVKCHGIFNILAIGFGDHIAGINTRFINWCTCGGVGLYGEAISRRLYAPARCCRGRRHRLMGLPSLYPAARAVIPNPALAKQCFVIIFFGAVDVAFKEIRSKFWVFRLRLPNRFAESAIV
jgi:hypothetical protein